MRILALSLLTLAAGCAATPQQVAREQSEQQARADKLAARLAGYTPGQPTDCLTNLPGNRTTEAIGATILYKEGNGLIYRNDTSGGCEGLEHGDYIVTVSNEGRLCRGDIGRTYAPTVRVPTGSCALGSFVPYRRQ